MIDKSGNFPTKGQSIEVLRYHVTYTATVTTPPCWMACRSNMAREVSERVPSFPGYLAGLNLDDKKSYKERKVKKDLIHII